MTLFDYLFWRRLRFPNKFCTSLTVVGLAGLFGACSGRQHTLIWLRNNQCLSALIGTHQLNRLTFSWPGWVLALAWTVLRLVSQAGPCLRLNPHNRLDELIRCHNLDAANAVDRSWCTMPIHVADVVKAHDQHWCATWYDGNWPMRFHRTEWTIMATNVAEAIHFSGIKPGAPISIIVV